MFKIQNKTFCSLTIILFLIEVLIATILEDTFLRPVFGDFLVVILIYSFLRCLTNVKPIALAICVLLFAYLVEVSQMMHIQDHLGITKNNFIKLILGATFDWKDIAAYTLGILLIFLIDHYKISERPNK